MERNHRGQGGGVPTAIGTTAGPSATIREDSTIDQLTGVADGAGGHIQVILLAWKGAKGDSGIWTSQFDGAFSGQTNVPDRGTSTGPSVVQAQGRTFMAWKGLDGDNTIYWARL